MQSGLALRKHCEGFCAYFHLGKKELFALLLIFIFVLVFFKPTISGDGYGYYTVLEGVFQDHTLNFERQMRFFGAPQELFNPITQKYVSKYAFGLPVFSSPLYIISLVLDDFSLFHIKDEFFLQASGDILIHQLPVALTSLIFLLIAFLFTSKILAEFFHFERRWLILLLTYFGTPLIFYSTYGLSYSHLAEAGLFSVLLFFALSNKKIKSGVFAGLLFITRYTAGIFLLPLLLQNILVRDLTRSDLRFSKLKGAFGKFKASTLLSPAKVFAGFLPFALFAMLYFFVQNGSPFSSGYESFESIIPIHFFQILFDLNQGLIVWSPLIILAIAGLLLCKDKRKWFLLSFIFLNLLVYGAWAGWQGAWSFGNRFFILLFPIYAIGLGFLLKKFPSKKSRAILVLLAVFSALLFLFFLAQRDFGINNVTFFGTLKFWFLDGNLPNFALEVLKKTSFYRFIFSV